MMGFAALNPSCESLPRECAAQGLLPDVGIDVTGDELLFLRGEWRRQEAGIHLVRDQNFDFALRLLLFPEAIEFP